MTPAEEKAIRTATVKQDWPSCDCHSYNGDFGRTSERVVDIRPYFPQYSFEQPMICLDDCIADHVIKLWQAGILTEASCCGHNGHFGDPNILVGQKYKHKAAALTDSRIRIGAWQLVYTQGHHPADGEE